MPFDLDRSLRALKPQKQTAPLTRRPDAALTWADDLSPAGPALMLDTTVYIDVLQGRTPRIVDVLLANRTCHHSSVCLAELTYGFGRLNPAHAGTKAVLRDLREVLAAIPDRRLHAPDDANWGEAGILAGLLARRLGWTGDDGSKRRLLNDAIIALQARALGLGLLTGNVSDFDLIGQVIRGLDLALYRCA